MEALTSAAVVAVAAELLEPDELLLEDEAELLLDGFGKVVN